MLSGQVAGFPTMPQQITNTRSKNANLFNHTIFAEIRRSLENLQKYT